MMVVDTSALITIVLREARVKECIAALAVEDEVLISAGTFAEALIVAPRRGVEDELAELLDSLPVEIVSVTADFARLVAAAHARWGKGVHPAALNFGDCFSYALAKERDCGLLFVGNDFSQTDVKRVL